MANAQRLPIALLAIPRLPAPTLSLAALAAGAVLWGASTAASKALLGPFPPLTLAGLRFALALGALCLLLSRVGARPATGRNPFLLGLTGVFLLNLFQNIGLGFTSATAATLVIEGGAPALTALFGALLLRERLNWLQATGLVVALAGAATVAFEGHDLANLAGPGSILPFGAALAMAAYNLVGRGAFAAGALPVVAGAARYGLVLLLPGIVLEMHHTDLGPVTAADGLWLLFLGIGSSAIAFVLWGYGLARVESGQAAAVGTLLPLSGVAVAAVCLGEPLGTRHLTGAVLVLLGIWLTTANRQEHTPRLAPESRPGVVTGADRVRPRTKESGAATVVVLHATAATKRSIPLAGGTPRQ